MVLSNPTLSYIHLLSSAKGPSCGQKQADEKQLFCRQSLKQQRARSLQWREEIQSGNRSFALGSATSGRNPFDLGIPATFIVFLVSGPSGLSPHGIDKKTVGAGRKIEERNQRICR